MGYEPGIRIRFTATQFKNRLGYTADIEKHKEVTNKLGIDFEPPSQDAILVIIDNEHGYYWMKTSWFETVH